LRLEHAPGVEHTEREVDAEPEKVTSQPWFLDGLLAAMIELGTGGR